MVKNIISLMERMRDYARVNRIPLGGAFELTARCNLHCKMCYICNPDKAKQSELSAGQWIDIARQARDMGMFNVLLTGGEPLIREDFWEIYSEIMKLGLLVTLNSNATTITPEVADALAKTPPNNVLITLYGSSPEVYKRVTGSAGAYEKAMRGVALIKERGLRFRLRTSIMRENAEDIGNIMRTIMSFGSSPMYSNYMVRPLVENGNVIDNYRLSPEEQKKYIDMMYAAVREYRLEHGNPRERDAAEIESEIEHDRLIPLEPEQELMRDRAKSEKRESPFFCSAGNSYFWATYDGLLTYCALLRTDSFDLTKMSFKDAFTGLCEAADRIPRCPECEGCEKRIQCSPCPAKLYLETGSYVKKAPYLCGMVGCGVEVRE